MKHDHRVERAEGVDGAAGAGDLPPEFYLPPAGNEALARQTVRIMAICTGFVVVLGLVTALTQGVVISLR